MKWFSLLKKDPGLLSLLVVTTFLFYFSWTTAKIFVCHKEDFLEAATGVLRSVMDKLVSLQEPQVSDKWARNPCLS